MNTEHQDLPMQAFDTLKLEITKEWKKRKKKREKTKCAEHWTHSLRMSSHSSKLVGFGNCRLLLTVDHSPDGNLLNNSNWRATTPAKKNSIRQGKRAFSFLFSYVIFATLFSNRLNAEAPSTINYPKRNVYGESNAQRVIIKMKANIIWCLVFGAQCKVRDSQLK